MVLMRRSPFEPLEPRFGLATAPVRVAIDAALRGPHAPTQLSESPFYGPLLLRASKVLQEGEWAAKL
eukprot:3284914-Amphidinium_carterae.1